jgi:Holliday junction resolvase RusA-like endonuclease
MMSGAVTIVIGGPPTAKGRPRMTRRGFAYTPAKTRKYEAHGRLAAQQAAGDSLVVDLVVTKKYAAVPALTVTVTPLPALTAQGRSA